MNNENLPAENSAVAALIQQRERKAYQNGWVRGMLFTHGIYGLIVLLVVIWMRA